MRERLFAVIDLVVQETDAALTGESVRAVAVDYRLLPIAVLPAKGRRRTRLLAARLAAGDRLAAIIALSDLDNLLHRRPPPRDCAVEATAVPPPARAWLAGLVRTLRGVGPEEAEKMGGAAAAAAGRRPDARTGGGFAGAAGAGAGDGAALLIRRR